MSVRGELSRSKIRQVSNLVFLLHTLTSVPTVTAFQGHMSSVYAWTRGAEPVTHLEELLLLQCATLSSVRWQFPACASPRCQHRHSRRHLCQHRSGQGQTHPRIIRFTWLMPVEHLLCLWLFVQSLSICCRPST